MPVKALRDYSFEPLDLEKNFHGNILVFVHWKDHLMFAAPIAFPFPPDMPFGALIQDVLPKAYGYHPEFEKIVWDEVVWELDHAEITPDMTKSLGEHGFGHKSLLCFTSPGLKGIAGASI